MSITTTSVLPAAVQQSFSYKLLSVPVPNMIHKIPAMLKSMPKNGGTTLRMRRYNPLNTAMVPLGNSGVNPPAQSLTAIDIDAQISFLWYICSVKRAGYSSKPRSRFERMFSSSWCFP